MTTIAIPPRRAPAPWLAPTGLILLSLIPIVAGAARLTELTGGAEITPRNARFFESPIPVVTHIVSVTVYSVCLLYTSPSPRDGLLSRMPSSA